MTQKSPTEQAEVEVYEHSQLGPSEMLAVQPTRLPQPIQEALRQRGYKLPDIQVRHAPFFWKVSWEELCTLDTDDPKVKASPLLAVVGVTAMPEAPQEFDDYRGMVRAEFWAEDGKPYAITHSYSYAATGELTPLSAWLLEVPPPFWARIGYVETRKTGRHVLRPLPLDIHTT